ncbi:MAG: SDR family NAD(P)-dependent oxidoreductase [Candidatus Binatia bacterium]
MKLLEEKTAIVTGSGQGIGRALARGLAQQGARIIVAELNEENGARVAQEIEAAGGIARFVPTDVSNEDSVRAMAAETLRAYGSIHILVNDAAIFPASSVAEMKTEEWEQVLRTNLTGTFFCSRAVMPTMKSNKSGRIINFTSGRALQGSKHGAHYAASKGGIIGFSKSLALELAPFGITVNSICPGAIDTPQPKAHVKSEEEFYAKASKIPLGRVGQPEDLVGPVLFLASDWSAYVTGQMIVVNGGSIMW